MQRQYSLVKVIGESLAKQNPDLEKLRIKMALFALKVSKKAYTQGLAFEESDNMDQIKKLSFQWDPDESIKVMNGLVENDDEMSQLREIHESLLKIFESKENKIPMR